MFEMSPDQQAQLEKFHASRPGPIGWTTFSILAVIIFIADNWSFFQRWFQ